MEKIRRVRRRPAMWRELFSRQSSSGVSVQEFCRREGINASLFWRWRSSLKVSGEIIGVPAGVAPAAQSPAMPEISDLAGRRC
jgi:transposase-like protein